MNILTIKKLKINLLFLFFSNIFYLSINFLYTWSTPEWFEQFPSSYGLRFLLSIGCFFLCCNYFFMTQMSFCFFNKDNFWSSFLFTFCPLIFFSILIFLNIKLQTLQVYSITLDVIFSLSILFLVIYFKSIFILFQINSVYPFIFVFSILYFVISTNGILSVIPQYLGLIIRFFIFSGFSLYSAIHLTTYQKENFDFNAKPFKLSKREKEVLKLILSGKTNIEISETLFISLSTVKTHISRIFEKTGAKNRLELAYIFRKD